MNKIIVPALIPYTATDIETFVGSIGDVPEIHIDMVDIAFATLCSWPTDTSALRQELFTLLAPYTLEVDLMVADPVPWAVTWEKLGADMVVFHVESISVDDLRSFISYTKMSVGISANNDTSFMTLLPYLSLVDYVQVMGIAKIGQQGQSFDKTALLRITEIHTMFPHLPISIDGSMNESTIPQVLSLPVERIIVGSAIQKSNAPQTAYTTLQKLASSTR